MQRFYAFNLAVFKFTLGVPGSGFFFIINDTVAPVMLPIKPAVYLLIWGCSAALTLLQDIMQSTLKINTAAVGFGSKYVLKFIYRYVYD